MMYRFIGLTIIALLLFVPAGAKAQDSLGALIFELNLSQGQIDQIRWSFNQFSQKQGNLPTAVDVALQNRASIRQVITGAPFNQAQAQQVAQQVTSTAAQRMVNRLELRNQIFQVLNPQQQQQYIQMIQRSLEGLE
jgi:Spy/CpxP family protein refolding chaperone